jgi:glycerophosphoryl diester phosphodiesterase
MVKKILLLLLVVILVGVYWFFKGFVQQRFVDAATIQNPNLETIINIAHRGASGHAPENSMAAFIKALEMHSDMIELDIHLSEDGQAVVIHDASLERTTSGKGLVEHYSMSELQELDCGSWFDPAFSGERIPSLKDVLALVNGKAILLIEIKRGKEKVYEGLGRAVVDDIRQAGAEDWCIVQAFDSYYILEVNEYAPDIETQKLIVQQLDVLPMYADIKMQFGWPDTGIQISALNSYYKFLTRRRVEKRHQKGYKTFVYTVNEEKDMIKMINLGVDGIITNYPDRLHKLKQQSAISR